MGRLECQAPFSHTLITYMARRGDAVNARSEKLEALAYVKYLLGYLSASRGLRGTGYTERYCRRDG